MLTKITLWLLGAGFLLFGLWALLAPASMATVLHFDLLSPSGTTEMRAFYGGLELGLGAFFLMAASRADLAKAGLILAAITMGTVASSRIFGLIIDGGSATFLYGALALEILAITLSLLALRKMA